MQHTVSIPFRGFDEHGEVRIYAHGLLPHWRQDGCTYFVTFRQADSVPQRVLAELEYERRLWLKKRGVDLECSEWKRQLAGIPKSDRRAYERLIAKRLNDELDFGHGSCLLQDAADAKIAGDAVLHFHGERVLTGDLVVMPNHVHALMTPLPGFELESVLHSIKGYSATMINRRRGRRGILWQRESYDHIVRDFEQLEAFQHYIARNPEKAGQDPRKCLHSPAIYHPAP